MDRLFHGLRHDGALWVFAELSYNRSHLRHLSLRQTDEAQARETRELHKRGKPPFQLKLTTFSLPNSQLAFVMSAPKISVYSLSGIWPLEVI